MERQRKLLVERHDTDRRTSILAVIHGYRPRLAAHFTILDVLLRRSAAGIDRDLHGFVAVRTVDCRAGFGGAVAEGEFLAPVGFGVAVGRAADHVLILIVGRTRSNGLMSIRLTHWRSLWNCTRTGGRCSSRCSSRSKFKRPPPKGQHYISAQ